MFQNSSLKGLSERHWRSPRLVPYASRVQGAPHTEIRFNFVFRSFRGYILYPVVAGQSLYRLNNLDRCQNISLYNLNNSHPLCWVLLISCVLIYRLVYTRTNSLILKIVRSIIKKTKKLIFLKSGP